MTTFVLLMLPGAALLVLAAHFARAQLWWLAVLAVGLMVLLAIPRRWAARTVQVAIVAGGFEWGRTLAALVAARVAVGAPYTRLARSWAALRWRRGRPPSSSTALAYGRATVRTRDYPRD